jgi:predicted RNase H-like HicB family nuclease
MERGNEKKSLIYGFNNLPENQPMNDTIMMLEFKLPFSLSPKDKWYVASCPLLDVHSQGDTQEQAKQNLREALVAFLSSCLERRVLDEVLKDCGLTSIVADVAEPLFEEPHQTKDYINIPLSLSSQLPTLCPV